MHAFWFIVWDDIWYLNKFDIKQINQNFYIFNPEYLSFIGYHIMPQKDLEALIINAQLTTVFQKATID